LTIKKLNIHFRCGAFFFVTSSVECRTCDFYRIPGEDCPGEADEGVRVDGRLVLSDVCQSEDVGVEPDWDLEVTAQRPQMLQGRFDGLGGVQGELDALASVAILRSLKIIGYASEIKRHEVAMVPDDNLAPQSHSHLFDLD
jgi:hypothetical protein